MGPSWWGLDRAGRAGHPGRVSPPQLWADPRVCLCPGCGLNRSGRVRGLSGWGGENSPAGTALGAAFVSGEGRVVFQRIFPTPGRAYAVSAGMSDGTGATRATPELPQLALVPHLSGKADGLSDHFPRGAYGPEEILAGPRFSIVSRPRGGRRVRKTGIFSSD